MSQWLDFKELRRKLDFRAVLEHYGVEVKVQANGRQHHGFCPLPTHNGKKNSASFSANLDRGIFHCFGCGAKGNVIEFAARMEGVDPANGSDFRKVALKLQQTFLPGDCRPAANTRQVKPDTSKQEEKILAQPQNRVEINAPLNFELTTLDPTHPYLIGRGFTAATIQEFGLGYCSRGSLKARIAIPLHSLEGRLIGYAGRVVDDATISEENPKYRLPSKRDHEGVTYQFQKSLIVYNLHRLPHVVDNLIVVEGFTATWWLTQAGIRNIVALMGASCGGHQAQLILDRVAPAGRIWLMPDGDDAGARCAGELFLRFAPYRFTRWVKLDPGKQPTNCSPEELKRIFGEGPWQKEAATS